MTALPEDCESGAWICSSALWHCSVCSGHSSRTEFQAGAHISHGPSPGSLGGRTTSKAAADGLAAIKPGSDALMPLSESCSADGEPTATDCAGSKSSANSNRSGCSGPKLVISVLAELPLDTMGRLALL